MPFELDPDSLIKLLAVVVTTVGAFVKRWLDGRAKVVAYLVHAASHPMGHGARPVKDESSNTIKGQPPADASAADPSPATAGSSSPSPDAPGQGDAARPEWVNTHAIVVRNSGKQTAHNVRIDHAWFPPSYNVYPPVSHTLSPSGRQGGEILIPVLVAGEQVTISYLYFPPLLYSQIGAWVKCDEGAGRFIDAIPNTPVWWPFRWLVRTMAFIGTVSVLYYLFRVTSRLLG